MVPWTDSKDLKTKLEGILPSDTLSRLRSDPKRCVATARSTVVRCKHIIKSASWIANEIPSTLSGTRIRPTHEKSLNFVEDLIEATQRYPHNDQALLKFDLIRQYLDDMFEDELLVFTRWIRSISSNPEPKPIKQPRSCHPHHCNTSVPPIVLEGQRGEIKTISTKLYGSHWQKQEGSQTFRPPRRYLNPVTELKRILEEPLSESEHKDGNIYMFRLPGTSGHLKIGYGASGTKRLNVWAKDGSRRIESVGCLEEKTIPHARRVERLIHAELAHFKRKEINCPCGVHHIEWFQVSVDHALAVYEKWSRWIQTYPYLPESLSSEKWPLGTHVGQKQIRKLAQPLQFR